MKYGTYAYKARDAHNYARMLKQYNIKPIVDQITQDMLISVASEDHFIDFHMIGREIDMLTNVKSLTFRLFADNENVQNHCNVSNGKPIIDTICNRIEQIDESSAFFTRRQSNE